MIIHFVRHCESIWNQDSKYAGHTNVPLSINGIQQSNELASKIKIFSINYILAHLIYCFPQSKSEYVQIH